MNLMQATRRRRRHRTKAKRYRQRAARWAMRIAEDAAHFEALISGPRVSMASRKALGLAKMSRLSR